MGRCSSALLLAVVACGGPRVDPPLICTGGGTGGAGGSGPSTFEPVGVVARPMTVTVRLPTRPSCSGTERVADEVVTEVLDPKNAKVEHTATAPASGTFEGPMTTITFTPSQPGSYHLSARFEPGLGLAQTDVEVAVDRSAAPSRMLALGRSCAMLDVLSSGLVLCHSSSQLYSYRNGVLLQPAIPAEHFAVAADAVWTVTAGKTVTRWVDDGVALKVSGQVAGVTDGALALTAIENEAVVLGTTRIARVRVTAAGLEADPFLVVSMGVPALIAPQAELKSVLVADANKQCTHAVTAGSAPVCTTRRAALLGSDATGLWTLEGARITHAAFGATVDAPLKSSILSLSGVPSVPFPNRYHCESSPVLTTTVGGARKLVLVRTAESILLEEYPVPDGFSIVSANSKTVRAEASDGRQLLFTR